QALLETFVRIGCSGTGRVRSLLPLLGKNISTLGQIVGHHVTDIVTLRVGTKTQPTRTKAKPRQ
ncbi:MAG: hypothetical protein AB7G34_14725, partial [Hyphomicrobiales bacterium]